MRATDEIEAFLTLEFETAWASSENHLPTFTSVLADNQTFSAIRALRIWRS